MVRPVGVGLSLANGGFALIALIAYSVNYGDQLWSWLYFGSLLLVGLTVYIRITGFSLGLHFVIGYVALFYILPLYSYASTGDFEANGREHIVALVSAINISGIHLFLAAYSAAGTVKNAVRRVVVDERRFSIVANIFFLLFIVSSLSIFYSAGGLSVTQVTRVELKEGAGAPIYLLWLYYMSAPAVFFQVVLLKNRDAHWVKWGLLLLVVLLCSALVFVSLRSRSPAIMNIFTFFVAVYSAKYFEFNATRTSVGAFAPPLKIAKFAPVLLAIVVGAIFLRFFRGLFFEGSRTPVDYRFMIESTLRGGDLGYSTVMVDVLELFEGQGGVLNGDSYLRLLWRIFPESVLGVRPDDTQSLIGRALTGVDVMTVPPGVAGDAYLNFGLMGLLVFLLYGFALAVFDKMASTFTAAVLFASSIFVMFHFVRGAFSNPIIIYALLFLSLYVARRLVVRR